MPDVFTFQDLVQCYAQADRNLYGFYFHFRFFLYTCELAQRSLKGSYAHRDEPHDSFQKVTELDC